MLVRLMRVPVTVILPKLAGVLAFAAETVEA
jgi:hypothetical protein